MDHYHRNEKNKNKQASELTMSQQLANVLDTMAGQPTSEILDGLRELERKTSLVFTLLKASVYSIVLQQEIDWGDHSRG